MSDQTTPEKKITIIHIDDDSYMKASLQNILEANLAYHLVAQFNTGKEAVEQCPVIEPDVIMIGSIPDMGDIELMKELLVLCPSSQIIMSTVSNPSDWLVEVFNAGGRFVVNLPPDKNHIYQTIDTAVKLKKSQ